VETYLARGQAGAWTERVRQARSAIEELTRGTARVRFDRSIYVPEDEVCFFMFEAQSRNDAACAARRAGLDPIRIVEAVTSGEEDL
jgi:hypothetical protein